MKTAIATAEPNHAMTKASLLRADRVQVSRKGRSILKGVSVRVDSGEIVGLLGPNGAGKTTFLSVVAGWVKADGGTIWMEERDLSTLSTKDRRESGLAVCPAPRTFWSRRTTTLEQLAASITREPKVICLDEPFNGIPPYSLACDAIAAIIKRLKESGCGVLITDHSVRERLSLVDRAYLICDGSILREGSRDFLMGE